LIAWRMLPSPRTARYSGRLRPAWRMNQTGVCVTGRPCAASMNAMPVIEPSVELSIEPSVAGEAGTAGTLSGGSRRGSRCENAPIELSGP